MKTFKSKISGSLSTPLILFVGFFGLLQPKKDNPTLILVISVIVMYSIFYTFTILTTYYIFIKDNLYIRYAYSIMKIINISTITEIRYFSNEDRNSYSLSHDRIEIIYANDKSIVISPKDKDGFIEEIQLVNPNVVVTY
jgi:hypothetical protein